MVSLGANVPVPLVVQIPALFVVIALIDRGIPAHELSFDVINDIGVEVNVNIVESLVAIQLPFPVEVIYKITEPAVVSAELGK